MSKSKVKKYLLNIDNDLWEQFISKIESVESKERSYKVTAKQKIIELIKEYVEGEKK